MYKDLSRTKSRLLTGAGLLLAVVISSGSVLTQQNRSENTTSHSKSAFYVAGIADKSSPITVGEKLNYVASWSNFLAAGKLSLSVQESPDKKSILVHADAETVGLVRALYAMSNHYDSTLDKSSMLPNLFSIRSKDSNKPGAPDKQSETRFDQAKHVARTNDGTVTIPPQTYDMISIVYAMRMLDLKEGKKYPLSGFDGKSRFSLEAEVLGPESIDIGSESYKAIKVAVHFGKDDETPNDENEIRIWFSNDAKHIPLVISANPPFGLVKVELRTPGSPDKPARRAMPSEDPLRP